MARDVMMNEEVMVQNKNHHKQLGIDYKHNRRSKAEMRLISLQLPILLIACLEANGLQVSTNKMQTKSNILGRRMWLTNASAILSSASSIAVFQTFSPPANADEEDDEDDDTDPYFNPNMPTAPEERSGLVVLRVAEVCNFQEKILRAVVNKDIDTVVSPQQIVFGTQILLRNSNIAGNMKLMIETEIPKQQRAFAVQNAVKTMNTLQSISTTAAKIQRPFTDEEMIEVANLYRHSRVQLNAMYEYLPQIEKDKYFGYFNLVTEYEKKIAQGVYNPEMDGVLKLDY